MWNISCFSNITRKQLSLWPYVTRILFHNFFLLSPFTMCSVVWCCWLDCNFLFPSFCYLFYHSFLSSSVPLYYLFFSFFFFRELTELYILNVGMCTFLRRTYSLLKYFIKIPYKLVARIFQGCFCMYFGTRSLYHCNAYWLNFLWYPHAVKRHLLNKHL